MFDKQIQETIGFVLNKLPKKWKLIVGGILFVLTLPFFLFWNWEEFTKKPLTLWVRDKYENIIEAVPKPIPHQFNIAIVKFENDDASIVRHELGKHLQNFVTKFNTLGTKEIRSINFALIPLRIEIDNELDRDSVQKGHADALKFLARYNYDAVIWGKAGEKENSWPTLFWTTFAHQDPYHNINNNEEKLPSIAIKDLTVVLGAYISTRSEIYAFIKGQDIADKIRIFIEELKNLLETSGNKSGWDKKTLWQIKLALAESLTILAQASESNQELDEAINIYEEFLSSDISGSDSLEKAKVEDSYGIALAQLSIRGSGINSANLKKAENAHLAALLLSKEQNPWQWARVQNNLALTRFYLGKNTDAEEAFNSTTEVWTKEKHPVEWARVQNNLGNIFVNENNDVSFEKAIKTYRAALTIRTKDRFPLDYASTQDNLGNALRRLGTKQQNTAYLLEAVEAHKKALTVWTKEQNPWDKAMAKTNLGETLIQLGELQTNADYLIEAKESLLQALSVRTYDNFPSAWAETLNDFGITLSILSEPQHKHSVFDSNLTVVIYLKQAKMAFSAAVEQNKSNDIYKQNLNHAVEKLKMFEPNNQR